MDHSLSAFNAVLHEHHKFVLLLGYFLLLQSKLGTQF
jgi:hypothetical protein